MNQKGEWGSGDMISVLVVLFLVAAAGGALITRVARRTGQDIRCRGQHRPDKSTRLVFDKHGGG